MFFSAPRKWVCDLRDEAPGRGAGACGPSGLGSLLVIGRAVVRLIINDSNCDVLELQLQPVAIAYRVPTKTVVEWRRADGRETALVAYPSLTRTQLRYDAAS